MELSLETFLGSWHHVLQYLSKDVPLPVTSYIPLTHFTVSLLYALTTIRSVAHTSLLRHSFILTRVQEYLPVFHRLRLSASP